MILTIITFIVTLAILILVHELGHFFAARRFRVTVEEFGIGFPPRLTSVTRRNTRYSLNAIPLGGFVKLKGEQGEEGSDDPGSFASKKLWQRGVILSAGVLMNVFLATVLLTFGFAIGQPSVIDNALPVGAKVQSVRITVAEVLPNSPAQTAGIASGDTILAFNGTSVETIESLQASTDASRDQEATVTYSRNGIEQTVPITPKVLDESGRGLLGIGLVRTGLVRYPLPLAVWMGVKSTGTLTAQMVEAIADLLRNLIVSGRTATDVTGPVGIAVLTGQVARLGFTYLLQFIAILSLNLALINILPIPALDGGRLLFLIIEKIRGRAVNRKLEAFFHNLGFVLLMLLMLVITYRDIVRFGGQFLGAVRRIIGV